MEAPVLPEGKNGVRNKNQPKDNLKVKSPLSELPFYPPDVQDAIDRLWDALGMSKARGSPSIKEFLDTWIAGMKMRGLAPKKGGRAPKKLKGILMALEEVWKKSPKKDARSLWRFFKKNYSREDSLEVGGYEIFFDEDPTGRGENFLYQRDENGREKAIGLVTFRRYVSQIKKDQF